jgi:uncharacterized integral membrane protein (TIGR00698 family)
MEAVLRAPPPAKTVAHLLVPAGVVLCSCPFMTAGTGLLAGLAVAVALGNPYLQETRKATQKLLPLAVVGLGAGMDLRMVLRAGAHGAAYTVLSIAFALAAGAVLSRWLRVGGAVGTLISVGTAICGGSAIAAMVPVLRPKEHEISVALATVFLLNAVALFAFPFVGHLLHLSDAQFGLWAALAIHDTSSVVGAAVSWGGKAVAIATTVKLARALWIVPLTIVVGHLHKREGGAGKARRPWFILGFVAAAAIVTYAPALQPVGHAVAAVARQALVVTLYLIGLGLTRGSLKVVGPRPLLLGLSLWVTVASVSLCAIAFL